MASGSRSKNLKLRFSSLDRNVKRKTCMLDFDTLECPLCLEPLAAPVYQCINGHTACGGCCENLTTGLCPSCSLPFGTQRCIAVEKIVESLRVHCKYATFGCNDILKYTEQKKRHDHEVVCAFRPFMCPIMDCNLEFPKPSLLDHIVNNHSGKIVRYRGSDDDKHVNKVKYSVTFSTDQVAYDGFLSQYVIVQVSGDHNSEDQLFLVHHQFNITYCSFSLTSFGPCYFDSSHSITVKRDGQWPLGRSRKTFKGKHSFEGPIYNNQTQKALIREVVRQGDCLSIPRSSASQKDTPTFEVEVQIVARRY